MKTRDRPASIIASVQGGVLPWQQQGSTVTYMEHIPATNDGSHWHQMESVAKVKVHQGWPAEQLTLDLTYEDKPPRLSANQTDCYYVRVLQRNGQRAWSSPIWVSR